MVDRQDLRGKARSLAGSLAGTVESGAKKAKTTAKKAGRDIDRAREYGRKKSRSAKRAHSRGADEVTSRFNQAERRQEEYFEYTGDRVEPFFGESERSSDGMPNLGLGMGDPGQKNQDESGGFLFGEGDDNDRSHPLMDDHGGFF